MTWRKPVVVLFIFISTVIRINAAFAQAPNISYTTPQTYVVGTTITPLSPHNTGGAVPAGNYGQVSTYAGNINKNYGVVVNGPAVSAGFLMPDDVAVDNEGNLYVMEDGDDGVRKISADKMVTLFAGGDQWGFANGQGTTAKFFQPQSAAVDNQGNLFVSDTQNNAIRKITPDGMVTTLAGNGYGSGATGFEEPNGLVVDATGNVYVADVGRCQIKKITPSGFVTVYAGNGHAGMKDGAAASAEFYVPSSVALDPIGNVYVADAGNQRIRKISPDGVVTTVAGNGLTGNLDGKGTAAEFNEPQGITIDKLGNFYISDSLNLIIRKMTADGEVTTLAGNGLSGYVDGILSQASFAVPFGLSIDNNGNIFVADHGNNVIREISLYGWSIDKPLPAGLTFDATTGIISGTPMAPSPATDYTVTAYNSSGSSHTIVNIEVDAAAPAIQPPNISYQTPQNYSTGTAIIPLAPVNRGGSVPPAHYGQTTTFAGSGVTGYADGTGRSASFSAPIGLAMDASGNIFVADYNNGTIRKITPAGVVTTLAGKAGTHGSADGTGANASFAEPDGVAVDKLGNIFVADSYNNLIREVSPGGFVSTFAGTNGVSGAQNGKGTHASFNSPAGLAFDNAGNLYVADHNNNMIRVIDPAGNVTTLAGSTQPGSINGTGASARFSGLEGIAADASGNIYVADTDNNLIREITPLGVVTTLAGSGLAGATDGTGTAASFNQPYSVTVDKSGVVYVADEKNNLIRQILPGGIVSTVAGNGLGTSVDGIGKTATFGYPGSIVTDNNGSVYVGDLSTFFIRKIGLTGYTIDKTLPAGLSFDPTTGIITGTPTVVSPATNYTITAYNAGGNSSAVVNITVGDNGIVLPPPPNISYQTPQTYTVNSTITPLGPTNTGGAVPPNIYGEVSTVAGNGNPVVVNGTGRAAGFGGPVATAFDKAGNLYVSEFIGNDIRKIDPSGLVSTFAGTGFIGVTNGAGNRATFNGPYQMAFDATGNMYVTDQGNQVIRMITPAGTVSTYAGIGIQGTGNGTISTASFNNPTGLTIDAAGNMYVADKGNSAIRKIDQSGQVTDFAILDGGSTANNSFGLNYLTTAPNGNLDFVNSNQVENGSTGANVSVVAGSGNPGFANGTGTSAIFNTLVGITSNPTGDIFVGDARNNMIRRISPSGVTTIVAGNGAKGANDGVGSSASLFLPYGLAIDPTYNYLYVADYGNNLVRKVTITGYFIDKSLPTGLTFDPTTGIISGTPSFTSPPVTYTITAYNTGGASSTTISIQIIAPSISFASIPTIPVCTADFDPGAIGSGPVSYTSSNTAVATIVSGKVHLIGPGTSIITANDGNSTATQILTVTPAVTPTVDISPTAADDCQGATDTFSASITNGGTSPTYQWQINGVNTGGSSDQLQAANLQNGDRVSCILTSNAACTTSATATSNTAVFTVDPPVTTTLAITSDIAGPVCAGTPITFTAVAGTTDSDPTYQWQINGLNAGPNKPIFTTNTFTDGSVVTCILTSAGKCVVNPQVTSNAITLSLNPQSQCVVTIPNTFTPNGDGINDLWDITALQAYPGCLVSIYNRYGSLIYNSLNYPKPWDGTYNGKRLPVGTYYYIINLNNGKKPLAGYVTIIR